MNRRRDMMAQIVGTEMLKVSKAKGLVVLPSRTLGIKSLMLPAEDQAQWPAHTESEGFYDALKKQQICQEKKTSP